MYVTTSANQHGFVVRTAGALSDSADMTASVDLTASSALSAVAATKSPIIFIGDGQHFENLEVFDALSFIKRLLGEGDIKQLMERVKDAVSAKDQQKLLEKVKKG